MSVREDEGGPVPVETTEAVGAVQAADAVETIQREMTVFARRARAAAGRLHPELSLVSYTLLGHLEEQEERERGGDGDGDGNGGEVGGCRATDLAAHYALDKSTVSRQVAALERAALIERRQAPDDHRVQFLQLTDAGRRILAQVTESRRAAFRERLAQWPGEDLERFAEYLARYNAGAAGPSWVSAPAPPHPAE